MTPDRWEEIKSIVALAMDVPGAKRGELVDSACGDDTELRREVESLLAAGTAESLPEIRAAIASTAMSVGVDQDAMLRQALESVVSHQYEIIRPLGRGGMGCVYLARERALERFVAIKILRPELAVADGHRERFRREARIVARLSHPGILDLHSFGEIGNLWYFVMSYVRGETLAERIRREGFLPWPDAHRIFTEMVEALECAHKNGVIHRDIKPANILLDSDNGRAILADFGISKMSGTVESLTATGAVLGTPDYMSPEQVTGASDIDERSDIYSLGAVAYVMLTGREPFRAETAAATIYRRLVENATPPDVLVPSIPSDLSSVVQRCMSRERTDRFPDARSLKEALDAILGVNRLPDAVRDLRGFGPYAILWATAWIMFASLTDRSVGERALLMLVALIAPAGVVLHLRSGAARGMRLIDLARIAAWPPEWWTMWWPQTLRRPADMWSRLPWVSRALRIFISASFPALMLLILMRRRIGELAGSDYDPWVGVAEWGLLGAGVLAVTFAFMWSRRAGIAVDGSLRLLLGPTISSPAWTDSSLTRVLAPASRGIRRPDDNQPSDILRAIREAVPLIPVTPESEITQIVGAAELLLTGIDRLDAGLARFARDAGPAEENRLVLQLDSLDVSGGSETGGPGELKILVRHQLDLVRRMQGERDVVARERAHFVDLLRSLWTLTRAACETRNGDAAAVARLRSFCAEVRHELS